MVLTPARALLTSRPEGVVPPPAIDGDRVIEAAWPGTSWPRRVHPAQFGWDRRFLAGLDLVEPGLVPARAGSLIRTTRTADGTQMSPAPLPVGQGPWQNRPRTRHRFRRVRNRAGSRRLPVIDRARQAAAPTVEDGRSRARCRRDQFVSGHVRASLRMLMVPDVTIPRPFAGTRPGYPSADGVCGG
jgi:hypothetical protein